MWVMREASTPGLGSGSVGVSKGRKRYAPSDVPATTTGSTIATSAKTATAWGTRLNRYCKATAWPRTATDVDRPCRPATRRSLGLCRTGRAASLLARAAGAEAALVVNNGAAAVLLVLAALAQGRSVIVSRGELVEIGGGFRIPEVMAQSGARLVEVGTTNRTRLADYRGALTDDVALVLKVHQSNYRLI